MTWRSILISQPARLSLQQQQLLIQQDKAYSVPLEDIAVIVIESREVIITAPLLSALAQYGVTLLTCDETFTPCGQWLPFSQHHRYLKILKLQLQLSEPKKKQLWQAIVKQKVLNQAWVAEYSGHDIGAARLSTLAKQVKSGDKNYIEGQAAALYFQILFGQEFYRSQENPINACLNYGYSIIRSAIARALVQYGFLPTLGICHRSELNAFNLADDLIEPYRPLVDLYVFDQAHSIKELNATTKRALIQLLHHQIRLDGKIFSVLAAIDRTIQSFQAALIEQDICVLRLPELLPLKEHSYE